jgi:sec-independent protein translocase protein TatC
MATATIRRTVSHDDRLSLVEHLDELRSRLIVCAVTLVVVFGVCLWQNHALLAVANHPLENVTQGNVQKGRGPLGEISKVQQSVRKLALADRGLAATLAAPGSGLSAAARAAAKARVAQIDAALKDLPDKIQGSKPVTLGIGEPFSTTLTVTFMFSLLIAMPLILYQLYAFIVPAFTPEEKRVARPLLSMIPFLFLCGVAFGYFLVLPAAVKFLQNFNADQFNIFVQAKDYYRFTALTLLATGLVFQIPVGILALTRLGVITVAQLRKNRRYAIVVCAVVAMVLPGTDPVSMLIQMVPLVVLFELSILLASIFQPKPAPEVELDEETVNDHAL